MAQVTFPFESGPSQIFGIVRRPVANADFWSSRLKTWIGITLIVDTGADYTLLPAFYAGKLGIKLSRDCVKYPTSGIGGKEVVYFCRKAKIKILGKTLEVPVGFLPRPGVPPLLGRQGCMEILKVTLWRHHTTLSTR